MLDLTTPEVQFAIESVRQATSLATQIQSEMTASELTKGDRSPVTVADFAVQALVSNYMRSSFSKDILVAEESSKALREKSGKPVLEQVMDFVNRFLPDATPEEVCEWIDRGNGKPSGRFWTLDPIDGTKGFLRGEQYAIAFALIENGCVKIAVLGCPHLNQKCEADYGGYGSLIVAVRGQGAWIASLREDDREFVRLHVSEQKDLSQAKMLRSVEAGHTNSNRTDAFFKLIENQVEPIYMDSQAKHAALSAGVGDLFFYLLPQDNPDFRMKIWDVAPGYLVINEAGGKMTDLEGGEIDFSQGLTVAENPGLLMTNGHLHDDVLNALRQVEKLV